MSNNNTKMYRISFIGFVGRYKKGGKQLNICA